MKVYVAERQYDYEGFEIIGICTTRSQAEDICNNDFYDFGDGKGKVLRGDGHRTQEFDLIESLE